MPYDTVFRAGLFEGQVALVTGGGSGIGRAIAHELAALGACVVVAGRDSEKLARVQREIEEDGGRADAVVCNIREEEQVASMVRTVLERHDRLDHVVNNAGGQFVSPVAEIRLKGWKAVLDTNLTGTFLVAREAFTQRMREHGGAIVNIVADMWRGMPMMAHSGAARAGVVNLTQSCALEWAPQGVRVNAVAPGYILSSGLTRYPEFVQAGLPALAKETPAARFGTESEVSAAVVFLLSPGGRYVNGATLRVDGASSLYKHPWGIAEHDALPAYDGFHRATELPEAFRLAAD